MVVQVFEQASTLNAGTEGSYASQNPAIFAGHMAAVMSAVDQESVWTLTCQFFRDLGFAHAIYGYSPDSRGAKLGSPEDYLVLSTFDSAVSSQMVDEGHYLQSLTFHWALQNVGVASWSKPQAECGVAADFVVSPLSLEFFARNGLMSGCSIGFPNERTRGNAMMALVAPPEVDQETVDAWLEHNEDVVFVAATIAHNRLSTLPFLVPRGRLTSRQREVLEWVAEGKTANDIATIMGISAPTVDKHLRLARETLGVETTTHALIKAAFLNQVFVAPRPEPGVTPPRNPSPPRPQ